MTRIFVLIILVFTISTSIRAARNFFQFILFLIRRKLVQTCSTVATGTLVLKTIVPDQDFLFLFLFLVYKL